MKLKHIIEGHWEVAPENYPGSILPKERKAKRHGILAYPEDRKRFMKNMGLSESENRIAYKGPTDEADLIDKPTKDFVDWQKYRMPDPPADDSESTQKDLRLIAYYLDTNDKSTKKSIANQDIDDLEQLYFDILSDNGIEISAKFKRRITNIVEQLTTIGLHYKNEFNRARPKQLLPKSVRTKIVGGKTANSPSYPSTHAIVGRVLSDIFSALYPKFTYRFKKLGVSLGMNRVKAGYHFLSDYKAGVDIAKHLVDTNIDKITSHLRSI